MEINNFIKTIMQNDLDEGVVKEIITRFPPEPNFSLHLGHARAIVTNFELAKSFNGKTNLRFDDTNPKKEDEEYVNSIIEDIKWLGYNPNKITYGSSYFDKTYDCAVMLIKKGLAYVCDLTPEEISQTRGTLNTPGIESPYRNRSIDENLKLFEMMKNGKFKDGEKTLRAKIDMSHPNMNMRDPAMYRIMHIKHHQTKDKWCIYPMYDFAHPLQDYFEGITHSLCSIEFDNHRILYDWFLDNLFEGKRPHQYEFGRLSITNHKLSKRYLKDLVDKKIVEGFDDPRLLTLSALRRKGYTKESIKQFILNAGLSRANIELPIDILEESLREDLKLKAIRPSAIIKPLKLIITNYDKDKIEYLECINNVENESLGSRKIAFSNEIYIEEDDFVLEKPNKNYKRLALGLEVRLMHAYFIKANEVVYDSKGNIKEVLCTYDINTKSGSGFNERKPNGTIHFVEAKTALRAKFNLYNDLELEYDESGFVKKELSTNSKEVFEGYVEEYLKDCKIGENYQFLRNGYYVVDKDSKKNNLVFNRTCDLKKSFK